MTQAALRYPKDSFPPSKDADISGIPAHPPSYQWGTLNTGGKRAFSAEELEWMANVIEWCLIKYPKMNVRAITRIMGTVVSSNHLQRNNDIDESPFRRLTDHPKAIVCT